MNKYIQIFTISFQQEFAYKANFILWRVRNVFQIFLTFFLWSVVFSDPNIVIFGYDRAKILTYVFGIMIVRAFVMSAKAADMAGDIAQGNLSNYLIKPMHYFKYWFTRDVASKVLNLSFAAVEFAILFWLLNPPLFTQTNPLILLQFALSIVLAMLIYFFLLIIVSSITFWAPEMAWGGHFLVTVVLIESLSGALFPINVFPLFLQNIIMTLPFPYLIYFPVQVYLGNITGFALFGAFLTSAAWAGILYIATTLIWQKGLKVYESTGR